MPTDAVDASRRVAFQALYEALIDNDGRTERICEDVMAVRMGRAHGAGRAWLTLWQCAWERRPLRPHAYQG